MKYAKKRNPPKSHSAAHRIAKAVVKHGSAAAAAYHKRATQAGRLSLPFQSGSKQIYELVKAVRTLGESSQHNDMTSSYVRFSLGRTRFKSRTETYYGHQAGWLLSSAGQSGIQQAADLFNIGGVGQHYLQNGVTFAASTSGSADNRWMENPFSLNPNQFATGGVVTNAESAASRIDRVRFHHVKGEIQVMNASDVTCEFKMYFFTCKKNFNAASTTYTPSNSGAVTSWWAQILSDLNTRMKAGYTGVQRVSNGATNTAPTGGVENITTYGASPFIHEAFRKQFTVKAVQSHALQPGSTKKIKFHIEMNKLLNREQLYLYQSNNVEWLSNNSVFVMVIAKGAPVYASATTTKNATPGPTHLAITWNYNCAFSYPPTTENKYIPFTDENYITNSTLAEQKVVLDTDTAGTTINLS